MWDKEAGGAHHVHAALGGGWPSLLPLCGNPVVAQVHYPGPAFKDCITTGDMAKMIQAKTNNPWHTTTHSSAVPALAACGAPKLAAVVQAAVPPIDLREVDLATCPLAPVGTDTKQVLQGGNSARTPCGRKCHAGCAGGGGTEPL